MKKRPTPPRLATWWFNRYCAEDLREEIQGDLLEAHRFRTGKYGKFSADLRYIRDVFQFFKPYAFEKHSRSKQYLPMFSNYFKISLRNILKHRSFTLINWLGLSIGLSVVMLIGHYLWHEMTYDRSFPGHERTFRLVNEYRDQTYTCMKFADYYGSEYTTQLRLTEHLKSYDDVEEACHFVPNMSAIGPASKWYVRTPKKEVVMDQLLFTNTGHAFQSIFPQEYLLGSPVQAFSKFQTVVLTASTSQLLFGDGWNSRNLIGSTLSIGRENFEIAGIVADPPNNIHFDFDIIVHQKQIPSWAGYTYFRTTTAGHGQQIGSRLNAEVETVYPGYTEDVLSKGIHVVPLTDIHFTSGMLYEPKPGANTSYLLTIGLIGLIILLIIWTNYANLSIAIYTSRQRELGIRKVMGARKQDISWQIVFEALILALSCLPFILGLIWLTIPYFNQWLEIEIARTTLLNPQSLGILTVLLLITGLSSGCYPALLFGQRSIIRLMNGKMNAPVSGSRVKFRSVLLTAQFFMLVGLMSLSVIILQQMRHVQGKSLGFVKEGVVFFDLNGPDKYQLLKAELEKIPEIAAIGKGMIPGQEMYNQLTYKMKDGEETYSDGTLIETSLESMELYGIQSSVFQFLDDHPESRQFIINRTAAKKLAADLQISPEEVIGKTIITEPEWENEEFGLGIPHVIADVIEDFDYFSLKYESQPLLIDVTNRKDSWTYNMILRLQTQDWVSSLNQIEQAYKVVETEVPFHPQFLDAYIDELYRSERNAGHLTVALTLVCIVLATMGLVGIVSYLAYTRQKEMGIRKVFGANLRQVLQIISREYVIMMVIATLLTLPVSMFLANQWLSGFAYRIAPRFEWITLLSGSLTLVIVLLVVISQSYHSANKNPTETLKYE